VNDENLIYRTNSRDETSQLTKSRFKNVPNRTLIIIGLLVISLILIITFSTIHSSINPNDADDPIIAKIGNTNIHLNEFMPFFLSRFKSNWEILTLEEKEFITKKYLREIVEVKVLIFSVSILSAQELAETETSVSHLLSKVIPQFSMQRTSSQREISECEMLQRIRNNLLAMKVKQEIISASQYSISEEELKTYYEEHRKDFHVDTSTVHLQQIHFNNSRIGKRVLRNLQNGSSFQDELKVLRDKKSECPEIVDLGIIELEKLDPGEQKLIASSKVGDYISNQYGSEGEFSISRILQKRTKGSLPFIDVQAQINKIVATRRENSIFDQWLQEKYRELQVTIYEDKLLAILLKQDLLNTYSTF